MVVYILHFVLLKHVHRRTLLFSTGKAVLRSGSDAPPAELVSWRPPGDTRDSLKRARHTVRARLRGRIRPEQLPSRSSAFLCHRVSLMAQPIT